MLISKRLTFASLILLVVLTLGAGPIQAKAGNEYEQIVRHLKTKYRAKKVKIPLMWLARAVVKVVRPAGVKSFSVTLFEDLQFSSETLDAEMQAAMRSSFGPEWSPILRVRSREGEQVYMYMREDGKNVKISLVTIDKEQAAVIRATVNPDKLAEFMENPKIFGISLGDRDDKPAVEAAPTKDAPPADLKTAPPAPNEPKKDN
ncbi:MAG: hypothetical protein JSS81_13030 [Acidobacteria bacterium]|nr:hypothetical protein [Acidobacteriota bacterium]